jgi:hypothetical protein
MEFVHLGHVAEDTGGGERESSSEFCALQPVLRIQSGRIRMFLGLRDPDSLVRGMDWIQILPFSHKGVEQTEIMLAK